MRLLILSAKTGGGHEMRASALAEIANSIGIETLTMRPLEEGSKIDYFGSNLYNCIQRIYPRMHQLYFRFLEFGGLHRRASLIRKKGFFKEKVARFSPDLVVSVHAHLNHGFRDIICNNELLPFTPKFYIYCGELSDGRGYSRHWINPTVDEFWVPFKDSAKAAISRGMPSLKCNVVGPLLRMPFYKKPLEDDSRNFFSKTGIPYNSEICLLATGANGRQNHLLAIESLINSSFRGQIIALCGGNRRVKEQLIKLSGNGNIQLNVLDSLNGKDMAQVIYHSRWIYGRPGAGLTTEALVLNKAMIFDTSGGVMPQEENNLNYWRDNCQRLSVAKNPSFLGTLLRQSLPPFRDKKNFSELKILNRLKTVRDGITKS